MYYIVKSMMWILENVFIASSAILLISIICSYLAEIVSNLKNSSNDISSYDTNSAYERIHLEKLAFVHRAVSVTTDPSGCNFAVLQSDPKTRYAPAI